MEGTVSNKILPSTRMERTFLETVHSWRKYDKTYHVVMQEGQQIANAQITTMRSFQTLSSGLRGRKHLGRVEGCHIAFISTSNNNPSPEETHLEPGK